MVKRDVRLGRLKAPIVYRIVNIQPINELVACGKCIYCKAGASAFNCKNPDKQSVDERVYIKSDDCHRQMFTSDLVSIK